MDLADRAAREDARHYEIDAAGRLTLVSDGMATYQEQVEKVMTHKQWFEKEFGVPLPPGVADEDLVRLDGLPFEGIVWALHKAPVVGFPHTLEQPTDGPSVLLGFAGYGSNSYALYLARAEPCIHIRLRIPWGGVYMERHRDQLRANLLQELQAVAELCRLVRGTGFGLSVRDNMGDVSVELRNPGQLAPLAQLPAPGDSDFWNSLVSAVAHLVRAAAPST